MSEAPIDETRAQAARTVLVVDDARVMRMLLKTWLELHALHVVEAKSATEAMALLARQRFDLVVCDVNMPGASGFAVLEMLKQKRTRPPFVFVTTVGREGDIARGLSLGADSWLTKPLSYGKLVETLRAHGLARTR